jgi:uncharacterized spore protein YtfJ
MNEGIKETLASSSESWNQTAKTIEKLFDVAQPGAVFSEPLTSDGRTVITASEVMIGLGVGYGSGGGSSAGKEVDEEAPEEGEVSVPAGESFGSGGGGGGYSAGRPVAAIVIEPEGVRVEPIVDVTKVALAFFTMLGSVFFMLIKMNQAAKKGQ